MDSSGRDTRFNMGYNMSLLSGETPPEIYGNPNVTLGRPPSSLAQQMSRSGMIPSACGGLSRSLKRPSSDSCFDERAIASGGLGIEGCGVPDVADDSYTSLPQKKSPPSNGKKTKGRVKIKMEYIDNKLRRYTTFSKRKTGIMKKAYELSTLTGTQVMLLVASETGHVYTFATRKLQPMITSEAGKALIQTCLNSPDPPSGAQGGDQRMSATGFEETELTYNIGEDDTKDVRSPLSSGESGDESSCAESPRPSSEPLDFKEALEQLAQNQDRNHSSPSPVSLAGGDQPYATPVSLAGMANYQNVVYQAPGGVLYPASALPQGVIFSLAQGGHMQLHNDAGGGSSGAQQYITIPLSMMTSQSHSNGNATLRPHSPRDLQDLSAKGNRK